MTSMKQPNRFRPDGFSFAILDNNLLNIPTTGIGDSLVQINLGTAPAVMVGQGTGPQGVSVSVVAAPESSAAAKRTHKSRPFTGP
jgi:hypothetical protein